MPDPADYDDEDEFVSDCIEERQNENPDEDTDQSARICHEMWRDAKSEGDGVSEDGGEETRAMSGARAFSAIVNEPWAMTERYLATMVRIASDRLEADVQIDAETVDELGPPEPQSLATETGEVLEGTRRVLVRDGVGIVPVVGPIFRRANLFTEVSGATSLETLARDLNAALEAPEVESVLLDVDSPGGEAQGVAEMSDLIHDAPSGKPIRAFVGGSALSGGFWIASAADEIVASETALLGSIGVRTAVTDTRERDREAGVRRIEIVSSQSPRKSPDPATEEGREQIQSVVDEIADVFVSHVARNRGVSRQTVLRDFGRGGTLVGETAVERGLADRIGTFEDEMDRLTGRSPAPSTTSIEVENSEGREAMAKESEETQETEVEVRTEPPEEMTAEEIRDLYPEAAEEIATEAAREERERIQAIEEVAEPGHDDLIAEAKFEDPSQTADTVSRQIVERQKAQREERLSAREGDEKDLDAPEPSSTAEPVASEEEEAAQAARFILTAGRSEEELEAERA